MKIVNDTPKDKKIPVAQVGYGGVFLFRDEVYISSYLIKSSSGNEVLAVNLNTGSAMVIGKDIEVLKVRDCEFTYRMKSIEDEEENY